MEMHQLRYAVAVARHGTFSRAAEHCHVSQPSLSQQIQKLEEELGERLFDRTKRAARPTPAGANFLQRAVRILDEVEAARREAADAGELLRGTLAVGVLPTIAPHVLPRALSKFAARYPGLEMIVHEDMTARLLAQLLAYEIDFAIASGPIDDPRFEVRALFEEELLLALPPKHRLARKRLVAATDLQAENLIVMKEGHCLGDQVMSFCEGRGLKPRIGFRSAQLETVQALVRAGLGVSLVPALAARAAGSNRPAYRPFQAPPPHRTIVSVWLKHRPPGRAATELLETVLALNGKPRAA